MDSIKILHEFVIFGMKVEITDTLVVMWILSAIVAVAAIILGKNLKTIPDGRQNKVEMVVEAINNLVKENMGEKYVSFIPYIGTLVIFLIVMNAIGLIGIEPPTRDYSVAFGLALISFGVVQVNALKKNGVGHYFKGYFQPFFPMLPLNIMERAIFPVSLSLRLFGNMTAAVAVVELLYEALGHIGWYAQLIVPIPVHAFFDIFDAALQMLIFVMLTMINIKIIGEH